MSTAAAGFGQEFNLSKTEIGLAIISPVLSGYLIDRFGSWELPFIGSMVLMGIGVILALRMQPESKFETEPADAAKPLRA